MKVYEGKLSAKGLNFALVVSRFNELLSKRLLEGALDCLKRHDAKDENLSLVWVPGSFESPLVAKRLAASKKYDAIIVLGTIIRGETPHFDYVAAEAAKGIAKVSLETDVPVAFGIITADTLEQAIDRAGAKAGNKGWQAALSAMEMANLLREMA